MAAVQSLLESIRWLQNSREYCDLKLLCRGETFYVHRAIICPRSKWFQTACKWGSNGKSKEELDLNDEDPVVLGLMVDYLYQLDYNDSLPGSRAAQIADGATKAIEHTAPGPSAHDTLTYDAGRGELGNGALFPSDYDQTFSLMNGNDDDWAIPISSMSGKKKKKRFGSGLEPVSVPDPAPEISYQPPDDTINLNAERLPVNALMYTMADKYEIEDLKALAKTKFEQAAREKFSAEVFAHASHLVFSTLTTDDELRKIVVRTLSRHRNLIRYEAVANLLKSENEMAWSLIQALI